MNLVFVAMRFPLYVRLRHLTNAALSDLILVGSLNRRALCRGRKTFFFFGVIFFFSVKVAVAGETSGSFLSQNARQVFIVAFC